MPAWAWNGCLGLAQIPNKWGTSSQDWVDLGTWDPKAGFLWVQGVPPQPVNRERLQPTASAAFGGQRTPSRETDSREPGKHYVWCYVLFEPNSVGRSTRTLRSGNTVESASGSSRGTQETLLAEGRYVRFHGSR